MTSTWTGQKACHPDAAIGRTPGTETGCYPFPRCPSDVSCIRAGNAEVQLTLSKAGFPSQTVVLNTTLDPKSASYAGYTVSLQDLKPYPVSTSTIAPGDYVATLLVTKP